MTSAIGIGGMKKIQQAACILHPSQVPELGTHSSKHARQENEASGEEGKPDEESQGESDGLLDVVIRSIRERGVHAGSYRLGRGRLPALTSKDTTHRDQGIQERLRDQYRLGCLDLAGPITAG